MTKQPKGAPDGASSRPISLRRIKAGMVAAARARAKKAGVPCTITPEDIVIPDVCPVLGIDLILGSPEATDASPSLDRVMPLMGYVPGNIIVISNRANRIKNDATVQELRAVAAFFEEFLSRRWMVPERKPA